MRCCGMYYTSPDYYVQLQQGTGVQVCDATKPICVGAAWPQNII